jgi:SAM-dependent methyltransferase
MATDTVSDVQSLVAALKESDKRSNGEWISSLNRRKKEELQFHDQWRDENHSDAAEKEWQANSKYYSTTVASSRYMDAWISTHVRDKVVLDYACGNGGNAIQSAKAGAALAIGLDISDVSVQNARSRAESAGLKNRTFFVQGDCENTGLPNESVDVVICNGMLHHLDLSYAFPELRRILKPGGVCFCYESLDYNPIIKLYRFLTPAFRTEWEKHHILSSRDLVFGRRFFDVRNVRYWHLMSILTTPLRKTPLFNPALTVANALDSVLLKMFPINSLAWIFTFELHKRFEE